MFIINTTTSVEFDQNLWCLSQILTDFENLWEFGSNTTDIGQIPQILSGDFGWRVVLLGKVCPYCLDNIYEKNLILGVGRQKSDSPDRK